MKKIVDYDVLYDAVLGHLIAEIQTLINNNWVPIGGIVVNNECPVVYPETTLEERPVYYQTMVKYENE